MYYSFRQFFFSINPGIITIPQDGFVRQIVSIGTKHGDIKVWSHGPSIQTTDMQADFSFSYRRGIPYPIYQRLIPLLQSLERRSQSKSTEPTESGSEMEDPGGNGVQERIAAYTERDTCNVNVDAEENSVFGEVMQDFMTTTAEGDFLDEVEKELHKIGSRILKLRLRMARYNVTP